MTLERVVVHEELGPGWVRELGVSLGKVETVVGVVVLWTVV